MAVTVACGGAAGERTRETITPSATPTAPTPTPRTQVASSTLVPPQPTEEPYVPYVTVEPPCPDPYPQGAPYAPTPGTPVHILSSVVPTPIKQEQLDYPVPVLDSQLRTVVRDSLGTASGHFAIVIENLDDGTGYTMASDRSFYSASLYKIWVMVETLHQRELNLLDWDQQFVVSPYYKALGLNAGELEECAVVTVRTAVSEMISRSDNVAANIMLDRVGPSNINRMLRSLGLSVSGFYGDNTLPTTAGEIGRLLKGIYRGDVVSNAASQEMIDLLESDLIDDRIPYLLPPHTVVAHKTGNWSNATHDVGLVFSPGATYLIVVLTDYGYEEDGASRIAALSGAVYDYYNQGG